MTYLTLHTLVAEAQRRLSANDWDFLSGGTETETSLRRNRLELDTLAFRPRVMRNVQEVDTRSQFLGLSLRLPLVMAPVGRYRYGGGPAAVAKAASEFGCAAALSSVNQEATIEEVAAVLKPGAAQIYQLYVRGDADWIDEQVDRVHQQKSSALCITVDTAVISRRERDIINNHMVGSLRGTPDLKFQAGFDWDAVKRVRDRCKVPMIIKGVNTAQDAALAIEHGFDAIWISNHGGRQIDHTQGSMHHLREVLGETRGRVKTIVDGAFYRGSDVIKALATGADVVGIGRMHCYALAAAGIPGLTRMLELFEEEMQLCMQLLGATSLNDLEPAMLEKAPLVARPDLSSPFPLLSTHLDAY